MPESKRRKPKWDKRPGAARRGQGTQGRLSTRPQDVLVEALFAGFCAQHPRCEVTIPWRGEEVVLRYRPTPRGLRQLRRLGGMTPHSPGVARDTARLLVEVLDLPDGPLTEADIMALPFRNLLIMARAIDRDAGARLTAYARERGLPVPGDESAEDDAGG